MENISSFSLKKVLLGGFIVAVSIYTGYELIDVVTRPPSYSSLSTISPQPKVVDELNKNKKGLAFLEMPVYPNNQDNFPEVKKENALSYADYQEKSQKEIGKVFTAMREAGNWCFNQWPVGSFNDEQIEIQVKSYLGGCNREQLLKMAATVKPMADQAETASSIQAYQLVAAALENFPGDTNKEKNETYHRLEEITLARDAAMSNEYVALDNMYSSQCSGGSKGRECDEIKSRIKYYLTLPSNS
jgi:hypothetical protein